VNPLDGLLYGFSVALGAENLLAALLGALVGTLVGVLPGLGPAGAMAILLPLTLGLRPETAVIVLAGIFYGAMYGGSTTAILLNLPGEPAAVVTAIDGYQMAQRGRAGAALAVAAVGSFVAGTLGVVALTLFAPALAQVALLLGPPEYFAIALLGLLALSRLSGGSVWQGLLVLGLGLAVATVGLEPVSATTRYTFGIVPLAQGIDLVPVAMGLFGLAEVLLVAERAGGLPRPPGVGLRDLLPNRAEWRRALPAILRGSGVGFLVGLLPGPAAVLSTFASYRLERRLARQPQEFGHGAIEGVAGPESANNAAASAMLVPLLAIGLPFAPAAALLLAALTLHGVQPGPLLVQDHPAVFWGVVASMYLGNLALLILNLPLVGLWLSALRLPQPALLAGVLLFMLVGTYGVNNSLIDLFVLLAMGLLGYGLRKLKIGVSPLVLAVVLGPLLEKSFRQSLYLSAGSLDIFITRPLSGMLLAVTLALFVLPPLRRLLAGRGRAPAAATE